MSIVAIVFLPVVLAYTAWNYYVFRKRISSSDFAPPRLPGIQPPSDAQPAARRAVGAAQRAGEERELAAAPELTRDGRCRRARAGMG